MGQAWVGQGWDQEESSSRFKSSSLALLKKKQDTKVLTHLLLHQLVLSSQNTCLCPKPGAWWGSGQCLESLKAPTALGAGRSTEMMLSKYLFLKRPVGTTVFISTAWSSTYNPTSHSFFNIGESINAFNPSSCSGPGEGRWVHTQVNSI